MPDANTLLMTTIRAKFGAAIAAACEASSVQPEFLAALIANESGGNPDAKRFEKGVLDQLWNVLQGREAAFGSIGRNDLLQYISAGSVSFPGGASNADASISVALQRLDNLATSYGVTQIMGYEAIPFDIQATAIIDPAAALHYTTRMLADFAQRFDLDLTKDFSELFDCWNSGRPHAPTADPQYIPNGLRRMAAYKALESAPEDSQTMDAS
jgi:hypothetical protein